jgi:hypothetical protein
MVIATARAAALFLHHARLETLQETFFAAGVVNAERERND